MIANTRKVLNPTTPNKNNGVLLKIVPHTRNIRTDLYPIRKAHPSNLPQRRVRLLRCRSVNPRTNPTLLRTALKSWRVRLLFFTFSADTDQLVNRWHTLFLPITASPGGTRPAEATKLSATPYLVKIFFIFSKTDKAGYSSWASSTSSSGKSSSTTGGITLTGSSNSACSATSLRLR